MYDDDKTQVLVAVVGGALTGLSSAMFLAAHGVRRVSSLSNATPICYNTSSRLCAASTPAHARAVSLGRIGAPAIRGGRRAM